MTPTVIATTSGTSARRNPPPGCKPSDDPAGTASITEVDTYLANSVTSGTFDFKIWVVGNTLGIYDNRPGGHGASSSTQSLSTGTTTISPALGWTNSGIAITAYRLATVNDEYQLDLTVEATADYAASGTKQIALGATDAAGYSSRMQRRPSKLSTVEPHTLTVIAQGTQITQPLQGVAVTITFNGNTVSGKNASSPDIVSVGQQIALNANVAGAPTGSSQTGAWSIDGTATRTFVSAYSQSTQCTPPGSSPLCTAVTQFQDPGTPNVTFHWIDGSNAPTNSKNVTYTVNFSGPTTASIATTAPFLVIRPDDLVLSGVTTQSTPAINVGAGQFPNNLLGLNLGYDADPSVPYKPGITFAIGGTTTIGGNFALTQLVSKTTTYAFQSGQPKVVTSGTTPLLDDGGTGLAQYDGQNGITLVPPGKSFIGALYDIPAVALSGTGLTTVQTSQQYSTYLMYQPTQANSIWVVLELLTWNWGATAMQRNPWTVVAGSASCSAGTPTSPIQGVDCSLISNPGQASPCIYLPTWTDYITDSSRQQ